MRTGDGIEGGTDKFARADGRLRGQRREVAMSRGGHHRLRWMANIHGQGGGFVGAGASHHQRQTRRKQANREQQSERRIFRLLQNCACPFSKAETCTSTASDRCVVGRATGTQEALPVSSSLKR